MTFSYGIFLLASVSCFLLMGVGLVQGRLMVHRLHAFSRISMPPSLAPEANSPSYDAGFPNPNVVVFDVRSFGAIGDGMMDDTIAFKATWDAACQVESATLFIPRGHTFMVKPTIFTGPCKQNLVFQIEGTVIPPDGPESWPKGISKKQWWIFYEVHGMTMHGGGVIDGKGQKWWNLPCKPHRVINGTTMHGPCDSPVAIRFFGNSNLIVKGLKLINSPQFHLRFDNCEDVHVDDLSINSPRNSPNTDGIHVENTINMRIYNSIISNGDDCISIGRGTHNLDIMNVTCGPSHGISIGSLGVHNTRACVSNVTVTNAVIKHSDNGVRIKTWQGGSGSVSSVNFNGIRMHAVKNPIIIDQYYCPYKSHCPNQTAAVAVTAVTYTNIKGTYDPRGPAVHLACSDATPCTNVTLSDVELYPAATGGGDHVGVGPFCWNVYGTHVTVVVPPVHCLLDGLPLGLPAADVGQC